MCNSSNVHISEQIHLSYFVRACAFVLLWVKLRSYFNENVIDKKKDENL